MIIFKVRFNVAIKLLKSNHIKTLNLEQLGVREMDAKEVNATSNN